MPRDALTASHTKLRSTSNAYLQPWRDIRPRRLQWKSVIWIWPSYRSPHNFRTHAYLFYAYSNKNSLDRVLTQNPLKIG